MPNKENLIAQAHKLTVEEQSKGGKKSGEVRRGKKLFREIIEEILDEPGGVYNGEAVTKKELIGIRATAYLLQKDEDGKPVLDARDYLYAFEKLRDTLGEKPMEKVAMTVSDDRDALDEILEQLGTVENAKPKG